MMSSEVAFKKMPEHDLSKLSADKSVWVRELSPIDSVSDSAAQICDKMYCKYPEADM